MKYYKLMYDYAHDKNYANCRITKKHNIDEYIMSKGNIIENWEGIVFEYDVSEGSIMTDYMANIYRWLIVSEKFCSLIKEVVSSTSIQYLSVDIKEVNKKIENASYSILNILDVVDAFDMEHSQYDIFEVREKKVICVEKYTLKKEKVEGHDIFRLKDNTIPVFVSEKIKKVIEKNKLLGFDFLEVPIY